MTYDALQKRGRENVRGQYKGHGRSQSNGKSVTSVAVVEVTSKVTVLHMAKSVIDMVKRTILSLYAGVGKVAKEIK